MSTLGGAIRTSGTPPTLRHELFGGQDAVLVGIQGAERGGGVEVGPRIQHVMEILDSRTIIIRNHLLPDFHWIVDKVPGQREKGGAKIGIMRGRPLKIRDGLIRPALTQQKVRQCP